MSAQGAAALVAHLMLAGGSRPAWKRRPRVIVLWRRPRVFDILLREQGVRRFIVYKYRTTVGGRQYVRYKVKIYDKRVVFWVWRLLRDRKLLRRWTLRYKGLLERLYLGERFLVRLPRVLPRAWALRWFGIRPFRWSRFVEHRNRAVVRSLKPCWRCYWYVKKMIASGEWWW